MTKLRMWKRVALVALMGLVAVALPDSARQPTQVLLVKTQHASASDVDPDMIWILLVGSDARPGEDFVRSRGDALQLVGINTRTHTAAIIGVPRDSWVEIPGYGSNKINAALYFGGPEAMGDAVGNLIGIQPDYVVVTRFNYFIDMVTAIRGIDIVNDEAFADTDLKPKGFPKGRIHLSGYDAMAFSRSRYALLRGDFERSEHQQIVLAGIAAKVQKRWAEPGFVEEGILSVLRGTATNLSPKEIWMLGHAVAQVDQSTITMCVVQGSIGNINGASVVLPFVDQARRMGDRARDDGTLESCD